MLHRAHPRAATPQRGAERRLRLRIPHLRRHPRLLPLHDEVPPLAGACGEQRSGGAPARVEPHARPAHRRRERLLLLTCLVEGEEGLVSQRFREGFPNPRGLGSVLLDLAHQLPGEGGAGDGLEDLGGAGGGHGGGGASGRRREGSHFSLPRCWAICVGAQKPPFGILPLHRGSYELNPQPLCQSPNMSSRRRLLSLLRNVHLSPAGRLAAAPSSRSFHLPAAGAASTSGEQFPVSVVCAMWFRGIPHRIPALGLENLVFSGWVV